MPNPISDLELAALVRKTPQQIIQFFRRKGYDITWSWRDMWQGAHARSFTVAKAMRKDILDVLRAGVDTAIAEGWSQQRFVREMTNALKAKGWWGRQIVTNPQGIDELVQLGSPWRLKTIYRTNQTVAFSRGRYQVMKDNAERRPYWMYDAVNDSITRPTHRELDNRIYRHDNPIWQHIHPPNGYNCRCRIRALTEAQAGERGYTGEGGKLLPADFPDEGWDYNPAEQTPEQLEAQLRGRA